MLDRVIVVGCRADRQDVISRALCSETSRLAVRGSFLKCQYHPTAQTDCSDGGGQHRTGQRRSSEANGRRRNRREIPGVSFFLERSVIVNAHSGSGIFFPFTALQTLIQSKNVSRN